MSLGAKQKSTTTTQTASPWMEQQPYLKNLFSRADALYNQSTPNTGLLNAAQGQTARTINGEFLDPNSNPYFSGALNNTLDQVRSKINSQFGGDNFGNSAHQEWLNRGMTEAASGLLANQYNLERGNQMNATAQAPGLAAAGVNLPFLPLQNYQQAVGGNYGGTTTAQQPYFTNPAATAAGLGIGALGLMGAGGPFAAGGLLSGLF